MKIVLQRLKDNGNSTIGKLTVDDHTFCTLEDPHQDKKIYGRTRIPKGTYEILLRKEGRLHNRYKKQMPNHEGMLWLQNVPGFSYIYIHIGNRPEDTLGCILVGSNVDHDDFISESTVAYIKLYAYVIDAMERGEKILIEIKDETT